MRVLALLTVRFGVDPSSSTSAGHRESPAKAVAVEGMADAAIRAAFPCGKPGESSGMNGRE
jgi:hypothetical protein